MNCQMTSLLNKYLFFILLLTQLTLQAQVVDKDGIPEKPSPPRLMNDYAEMLSITEREQIEQKLVAYNDSTSTQICVVTVNTIGDYSIADYAVRLGRKWGIGQKDKDNGILITISKLDRKVDIEIGYGLESHITDYDSKEIIDDIIIPAFKQNNFYEGVNKATDRIISQLQGTFTASTSKKEQDDFNNIMVFIFVALIFIIIISSLFSSGKGNVTVSGGGWNWSSGGGSSSWSGGGSSSSFGGFGDGSFGGGGSSGSW